MYYDERRLSVIYYNITDNHRINHFTIKSNYYSTGSDGVKQKFEKHV